MWTNSAQPANGYEYSTRDYDVLGSISGESTRTLGLLLDLSMQPRSIHTEPLRRSDHPIAHARSEDEDIVQYPQRYVLPRVHT